MEPVRVREDVVLAIHRRQIAEHGGPPNVRDQGLLESALNRPKNRFNYAQPPADLARLAAAYAFGIVGNHPFLDGNKRTALIVCRTFLLLNGHDIEATQIEKYEVILGMAGGNLTEEQLAAWIRKRLHPCN